VHSRINALTEAFDTLSEVFVEEFDHLRAEAATAREDREEMHSSQVDLQYVLALFRGSLSLSLSLSRALSRSLSLPVVWILMGWVN